jgi:hypothetical protein
LRPEGVGHLPHEPVAQPGPRQGGRHGQHAQLRRLRRDQAALDRVARLADGWFALGHYRWQKTADGALPHHLQTGGSGA